MNKTQKVLKALSLGTICYAFHSGHGRSTLYQMTVPEWQWSMEDVTPQIKRLLARKHVMQLSNGRVIVLAAGRAALASAAAARSDATPETTQNGDSK